MKSKHDIVLSILISFFFSLFTGFILNYFGNLSNIVSAFLVIFIFSISFLIFNYSLKYLISKSVKNILDQFYSNEYKLKDKSSIENLETLSDSIKNYASEKKLEIELLKEQENYRKDFIGNLAHELKTPLFTSQSYLLTLIDGALKDEVVNLKYLKIAEKAIERLIFIVKDLDLITKLESEGLKLEKSNFNIISVINNVFEMLEIQADKKRITLFLDPTNKKINVNGDQEKIHQVLTNLIENSIKYGKDSGTTEVSVEDITDNKVIIRITDNGNGIQKMHFNRLFERFYRIDNSGSRSSGGSGLGLAIVKHIIDAHNEKIYVESDFGIGSEFSFTLEKLN